MTMNGVLNITTILKDNNYKAFNETKKKYYVDTKHVQSAMVQGWNKFCMTGGIIEYSAKLPGKSSVGGLWPACKSFMRKKTCLICDFVSCLKKGSNHIISYY